MKYFKIGVTSNPKIIGVRNGTYQADFHARSFDSIEEYEKHKFDPPGYWAQNQKGKSIEDINIKVNELKLLNNAKITDFMLFASIMWYTDYLTSERLKNILQNHNLPQHKFFETKVCSERKNIHLSYYFFYCPEIKFEQVVINKSVLHKHIDNKFQKEYSVIELKDLYQYTYLSHNSYTFKIMCLPKEFSKFDFIRTFYGDFISERLLEQFEKEKITAYYTNDYPELIFS